MGLFNEDCKSKAILLLKPVELKVYMVRVAHVVVKDGM
jgi:hypothetical protein